MRLLIGEVIKQKIALSFFGRTRTNASANALPKTLRPGGVERDDDEKRQKRSQSRHGHILGSIKGIGAADEEVARAGAEIGDRVPFHDLVRGAHGKNSKKRNKIPEKSSRGPQAQKDLSYGIDQKKAKEKVNEPIIHVAIALQEMLADPPAKRYEAVIVVHADHMQEKKERNEAQRKE